jgi:hypothetical protein
MPFTIDHLDHLVLTVADIGVTIGFHTNVLGMQAVVFGGRKALTFGRRLTCTSVVMNSSPRPLIRRRIPATFVSSRRSR